MKRTAELRGLSEDHHHGLVQARRLRRAGSGEGVDSTEMSGAFLDFWQKDTSAHFRKEEEVLLPVLARHGVEMLAQHAELGGLVMELSDEVEGRNVRKETLQAIGERLEEHIRLEEREVFPMLEESLPKEALEEFSSQPHAEETAAHHPSHTTAHPTASEASHEQQGKRCPTKGSQQDLENVAYRAWPPVLPLSAAKVSGEKASYATILSSRRGPFANQSRATAVVQDWSLAPRSSPV